MYSNLLNYINSRLPDNITKLITPAKMRQNFAEVVGQLGQDANFMGIVTPSDTIAATEVKQFYVAVPNASDRTFTNFGGTITVPAFQGCIFFYASDAWGYQLVNFDSVLQICDNQTDDDLPVIFQDTPKILTANKTAHVEYSGNLTFNPYQKMLTAGYFKGDGSMLSNLPYPAEDYHSYSANETSIVFGSLYSYHEVEVTGATQTFNINIPTANTYVNYLLVKNSGSGTCTIALAAASGMLWTSFVLPTDAIEVDAGECIELSFISIDNHSRLVVTKSAALEITTLS